MLRILLEKIIKRTISKSKDVVDEIVTFLGNYEINSYIYPSVIKRKFDLSTEEIYQILNELEKEKLVKIYYKLECYQCNKNLKLVERYSEIDEIIECEDCNINMEGLNNVHIIYKVMQ